MKRLTLQHLVLSGRGDAISVIEFDSSFTVIHGPSESGKSFIFETMDYVLGAKDLRQINELTGYSYILLALTGSDDIDPFTLCRSIDTGNIEVFDGIHSTRPTMPGKPLKQNHRHNDATSVSGYMLERCELDGWSLYKAGTGETTSLSFRELSHVIFAAETKMQGRTSPFESGVSTNVTKERSLVRCLLAGESDPPPARPTTSKREVKQGQLLLISRVLRTLSDDPSAEVEDDLLREAERHELESQLQRLDSAISETSRPLSEMGDDRELANTALKERSQQLRQIVRRTDELAELAARFRLLERQYISDLARLETIEEAGWVLSQESTSQCPLCGSPLSALNGEAHRQAEASVLFESVDNERLRVNHLLEGLQRTLNDVDANANELAATRVAWQANVNSLRGDLRAADAQAAPVLKELEELQAKRTDVQRRLQTLQQIEALGQIRDEVQSEGTASSLQVPSVQASTLNALELEVKSMLLSWNVDGADNTSFDPKTLELTVGGKPRRNRGKGMRAVLSAACLLGLAQYCWRNNLPHPGFVVLDSPLVTFKGPKSDLGADEELIPETVVEAFYEFLDTGLLGQAVVMENTEPGSFVSHGRVIEFTGNDTGRRGFLTPVPA